MLEGIRLRHPELLHLVGGALLVYASLSVTITPPSDRWIALAKLVMLSLPFFLGRLCDSIEWIWKGFIWMLLANAAVSIVEWYGYGWLGYGIAGNPNYFGVALALGLAAALGYRWWPYVPFLIAAVLWTNSRGSIAAGGVAIFCALWYTHRATGFIGLLLSALAIVQIKTGAGGVMWERMGIWQDTLNHLAFFGNGWGSFESAYAAFSVKTNMTTQWAGHAYNDVLELMFELGIGSVLVWWLIAICWEGRNWPDRLICVTFFVAGLTYFPLSVVGPLFTLTLGHLSKTKDEKWHAGRFVMRTT